jgi:hypothetical protein
VIGYFVLLITGGFWLKNNQKAYIYLMMYDLAAWTFKVSAFIS